MKIILATNNKNKVREIKEEVAKLNGNIQIQSQSEFGINIDVEETGKTFEENATLKAKAIYNQTHLPVIADDSGLMVDKLNGEPGIYSKRYAGENATDEDKINKILNLLKGVQEQERTAHFVCAICYIDENGKEHIFKGVCDGIITTKPHGEDGFGYDPIFDFEGKGRTFAQFTSEEKNQVSHRGKAVKMLMDFLMKTYKN